MITRKPRAAMAAAWPYRIQLVKASEKKPWSSSTGRPSPISRHASLVPSKLSKKRVSGALSVGEFSNGFHPAIDNGFVLVGAIGWQTAGVEPCLVPALDSVMMGRTEAIGVV